MTTEAAVAKLRETGDISTEMLAPLGISMDGFLRFAQYSAKQREAAVANLLAYIDAHGTAAIVARKGK